VDKESDPISTHKQSLEGGGERLGKEKLNQNTGGFLIVLQVYQSIARGRGNGQGGG